MSSNVRWSMPTRGDAFISLLLTSVSLLILYASINDRVRNSGNENRLHRLALAHHLESLRSVFERVLR